MEQFFCRLTYQKRPPEILLQPTSRPTPYPDMAEISVQDDERARYW